MKISIKGKEDLLAEVKEVENLIEQANQLIKQAQWKLLRIPPCIEVEVQSGDHITDPVRDTQ